MNIALKKPGGGEYYIASIRKDNGHYVIRGKCILPSGKLRQRGREFTSDSFAGAKKRCRQLASMKVKRRGYTVIQLEQIPDAVVPFLERPPDMQLTKTEMVKFLRETRRERYVVFKDVTGLEEYFDAGVEYIAYETRDKEVIKVHDRFGTIRQVFRERLESVEPTELCMQLRAMNVRPKRKSSPDT